jgi:cellobiose phosphorylase
MQYGRFDDEAREFAIERPDTPFPWINYLGTGDFRCLCSNTAGGYAFYRDALLRRVTRFRYNSIPVDMNGRYYFIKDGNSVWNPG